MQLARIGLIIVLSVALGSPVMGQAAEKQSEPVKNPTGLSEPQKVVWDYFAAYIAYSEYEAKKGDKTVKPVPKRSLDPSFVTQHFIDSYHKLMQEDKKTTPPGEVGYLDYDPIICGQDFPDSMTGSAVDLVENTGTEATIKVGWAGFDPPATPFMVKLKKQDQGWRIDAIVCGGDDFDSKYQKMQEWYKQQKK
ncbi:MAG: DUF3828 domain-containing protein [Desulfobaccales bacterium]